MKSPFSLSIDRSALNYKGDYDILSGVRTVYQSTFNELDITTQIKCLQELVFNAMIAELESNGVDTSGLLDQKTQIMNVNISGDNVNMGNIVQGVMNKIRSSIGVGNQ